MIVGRIEQVAKSGPQILYDADAPKGKPVASPNDGATLLRETEQFIARYIILPLGASLSIAAWILATYCLSCFDIFPYLAITSPVLRCGKSNLLRVLKFLCSNPIFVANLSEAALFRTIEEEKPTLLLDESEWLREKSERAQIFRNLLNAGHESDATVIRCTKDGKREKFGVFCPKAIAAIGELNETLADRSIHIQMQRKMASERVERFHRARVKKESSLVREQIIGWVKSSEAVIRATYESMFDLQFLDDRAADNFSPIFAVVSVADSGRIAQLHDDAIALSRGRADDAGEGSLPLRLLLDFCAVARACDDKILPTKTLISKVRESEDSPFASEVELTGRRIAQWLRPFGIRPARTEAVRGYQRGDLLQAGERYGGA